MKNKRNYLKLFFLFILGIGVLFFTRIQSVNANGFSDVKNIEISKDQLVRSNNVTFKINSVDSATIKGEKEIRVNLTINQSGLSDYGFKKNNVRFSDNMRLIGSNQRTIFPIRITDNNGDNLQLDERIIGRKLNVNLYFITNSLQMDGSKFSFIVPNGTQHTQYNYLIK